MENVAITNNEKPKKPSSQALKEAKKRYYEKNKDQIIKYITEYNKTHPEVLRKAQKYITKKTETIYSVILQNINERTNRFQRNPYYK